MTKNNDPENQDEVEVDDEFDVKELTRKFIEENQELFDKLAQE